MTTDKPVIRSFELERDLEAWTAIHNDLAVAAGTLRIPFEGAGLWQGRFANSGPGRILVAEIDGQVIGGIGFHRYSGRTRHAGTFGMGVLPAHQGRGVGSALLTTVIDLADNWYNLRRLELEVWVDNEAAIGLYRKFGFEEEGVYRRYGYINGHFVDALAMARIRDDP